MRMTRDLNARLFFIYFNFFLIPNFLFYLLMISRITHNNSALIYFTKIPLTSALEYLRMFSFKNSQKKLFKVVSLLIKPTFTLNFRYFVLKNSRFRLHILLTREFIENPLPYRNVNLTPFPIHNWQFLKDTQIIPKTQCSFK